GAPLFCSERRNIDGTAARVGNETLRSALTAAAAEHLPDWPGRVTPHVLRHFCASQLYLGGMDLVAIQQALGHAWVATTMNYIHVHATHVEDAWIAGQRRAAGKRLRCPPSPPGRPGRSSRPSAVTDARSRPPNGRADPGPHPDRQLPGLPVLGPVLRIAVVLPGLL